MKKFSGFARWGPAAGVLAVGMLAFSLSLEGAAPSPQPAVMKERAVGATPVIVPGSDEVREVLPAKAEAANRAGHATSRVLPADRLPEGFRFGHMPKGDLPIMDSMTVDYRDDTGTRLRQAGLLVGPYRPNQVNVAGGPCSFDIQCDDCDPCTNDVCSIAVGAPLLGGTCVNSALPDGAEGGCSDGLCCNGRETCQGGVCELPGFATGTFDPGGCEFPCSGGNVCNEDTGLCRLPCDGTSTCAITLGACNSTVDCPPQEGNYCRNCNDGVICNGTETCVNQRCEAGTNPCGPGATCGERACSANAGVVCTTDSDCTTANLGTCTRPGPVCFTGRCCINATAEPACTRRKQAGGTCPAASSNGSGSCQTNAQCRICTTGTLIGTPCTSAAECGGGTCGAGGAATVCNLSASCDVAGGNWYSSDDGDLGTPQGGTVCPTPAQENPANDRTLCPKYSSGLAPLVDFDTEVAFNVGLFSQGPCDHDDVGDDYQIENLSPIAMEHFRWIGGGGGRLLVEFYDDSTPPNFIEDVVTGGIGGGTAVHSLNFLPPLTIPAKGFFVISVATNFAPNGQTFVTATTAPPDEGVNLASGPRSWWIDGAPSSITLRECVGGTNDGDWCDPDDLGDTECVGGGGACANRDNVLAFEIEGLKTPAPTGACCNNGTGVCTPGVIPWVCNGQGNNYQGNDSTCPGTCGQGACCVAGVCSLLTGAACPGPDTPPNFLGFGTDCDPNCCTQPAVTGANNCAGVTVQNITVPDPGDPAVVVTISGNNAGATGPDTCLQGAWNAAGGTYLTVDPGWWEAFNIDACAFVRVDFCCSEPVVEPQWALIWEGCPCDDPRFTAVNPNVPEEPANKRGEPYCKRGDDNLWNKFGPLPGGTCILGSSAGKGCTVNADCPGGTCTPGHTYYAPVYSVPPGLVHGPYQMHITVEACPVAACCDGTTCIETDQLGCAAVDGANFLAPPFRTTATVTCSASTCNTGSCCYVPNQGLCQDVISGQLATLALCNSANGDYQGGARCNGCICSAGAPAASCNDDGDCGTNGPCINPTGGGNCSGQNLTQTSPCPVCDFESNSRCQKQPGYDGARLSDLCAGDCVTDPAESIYSLPGIRAADDFVAAVGGSVTSVCVWGIYGDQLAPGLADCSANSQTDEFIVTIYNDASGLPGIAIGAPRTTTIVRKAETFLSGTRHIIQHQLALSSGIPLVQGNTYWLEVVANTNESTPGLPGCDWFWALSDPDQGADSGNQFILQDAGSSYTFGDAAFDGSDLAWCINLDNTVPLITEAACCTCGGGIGTCSVQTLEDCTNADGSWQSSEPDCIGVNCRNQADGPDNCVNKQAVATSSNTAWNNFCCTTPSPAGSPSTAGNDDCSAGLDAQADLWYSWTATCTGDVVIETCDGGGEIDTMVMIYTDNNGTCPCPTSAANEFDCNDDGCVFTGAASRITLPAVSGVCYTIRVAGFLGQKGSGVLHVADCDTGVPQPIDLTADPIPALKTRFISFSATGGTGETAIRVNLDTLHLVVPPYTGGPSIQFTDFEGQSLWVGPPAVYMESGANPTPYKTSNLQCTPHYRDWNTEGLVHVTGSAIAPSSTYLVENVSSACQGIEGTAACTFGGSSVSANQLAIATTRWADVETPYAPGAAGQPSFSDVTALVAKFRSVPGSPIKARALILGNDAFGNFTTSTLSSDLNFGHIAACVDAFRGTPYPFEMGECPVGRCKNNPTDACVITADCPGATGPCTFACTTTSNCQTGGPCTLYCP